MALVVTDDVDRRHAQRRDYAGGVRPERGYMVVVVVVVVMVEVEEVVEVVEVKATGTGTEATVWFQTWPLGQRRPTECSWRHRRS